MTISDKLYKIIIGMLIYLAVSYIVFAVFAISDRIKRRKRGDAA